MQDRERQIKQKLEKYGKLEIVENKYKYDKKSVRTKKWEWKWLACLPSREWKEGPWSI